MIDVLGDDPTVTELENRVGEKKLKLISQERNNQSSCSQIL